MYSYTCSRYLMRNGWPLTEADKSTFYTGGPRGYVDYPVHGAATVTGTQG